MKHRNFLLYIVLWVPSVLFIWAFVLPRVSWFLVGGLADKIPVPTWFYGLALIFFLIAPGLLFFSRKRGVSLGKTELVDTPVTYEKWKNWNRFLISFGTVLCLLVLWAIVMGIESPRD